MNDVDQLRSFSGATCPNDSVRYRKSRSKTMIIYMVVRLFIQWARNENKSHSARLRRITWPFLIPVGPSNGCVNYYGSRKGSRKRLWCVRKITLQKSGHMREQQSTFSDENIFMCVTISCLKNVGGKLTLFKIRANEIIFYFLTKSLESGEFQEA